MCIVSLTKRRGDGYTLLCLQQIIQTSSLRGVGVTATVEETIKGALPSFDQGTVGINVMPLGSAEVRTYRRNSTWRWYVDVETRQ